MFDELPTKKVDADLVSLAEELIQKKAGRFPAREIQGHLHRSRLRELIKAKEEKRPPREIEETPPVSNVINLMDALKRSVGKGGGGQGAVTRPASATATARLRARPRGEKPRRAKPRKAKARNQDARARPAAARRRNGAGSMPRGALRDYHAKRDFARTAEPKGAVGKAEGVEAALSDPEARRARAALRFPAGMERRADELGGAAGARAKTPTTSGSRSALEDHPLDYGNFEGTIPKGEYGGGTVMLWDTGTWTPQEPDVEGALKKGKLAFMLAWRAAARQMGAGEAAQALAEGQGQLAADQGARRLHAARRHAVGRDRDHEREIRPQHGRDRRRQGGLAFQSQERRRRKRDPEIMSGPAKTASTDRSGSKKKSAAEERAAETRRQNEVASAKLPAFVEPQLATLVDGPPGGNEWLHEIKYDGYRASPRSRAARSPSTPATVSTGPTGSRALVPALQRLALRERAARRRDRGRGRSRAIPISARCRMRCRPAKARMTYYLFDLLELDGEDLRGVR